ncbi:hypothetical protein QTP88_028343 [Uroleucon formosanum]
MARFCKLSPPWKSFEMAFRGEIGIPACIKARQSSELNEFLLPEEVAEAKN